MLEDALILAPANFTMFFGVNMPQGDAADKNDTEMWLKYFALPALPFLTG